VTEIRHERPDQYVLGYRQAEQRRLQQQAQQLADESSWLFDQTGMARGARVVEIGCLVELLATYSEKNGIDPFISSFKHGAASL
jgi:hypothetical protein